MAQSGAGTGPDSSNPFCASCDKVPRNSGIKYRCHVCRSVVDIADIKDGKALALDEKVFCSTCKRRAHSYTPEQPVPVVKRPEPPNPAPPTARMPERTRPAPVSPPPEPELPDSGGPLQCDMCSRSFSLEDLRSGKAEIRDSRVLCPRCIARIDRKRERFDLRFIASLAFILVVFPVGAAGLAFLAIQGGLTPRGDKKPDNTRNSGRTDPDSGGKAVLRPKTAAEPAPKPQTPPAAKTPVPTVPESPADAVRGIPKDALDQIIANLRNKPQPPTLPDPGSSFPESTAPVKGGDPSALLPMIESPDPAARLEGVLRLSSTGCPDDVFLKAVSDRDPFVRSAAAVVLARRKKEAAVAPLLDLIRDPDPGVRRTASQALLEAVNVSVRFVEDFSREDLEKLRDRLDRALERKAGDK